MPKGQTLAEVAEAWARRAEYPESMFSWVFDAAPEELRALFPLGGDMITVEPCGWPPWVQYIGWRVDRRVLSDGRVVICQSLCSSFHEPETH